MRQIAIGNTLITQDSDAFVVAEIGHNHGGDLKTALAMVWAAKQCGCNAVKLQKRTNDRVFTKAFLDTPYNSEHAFGPTYGTHRAALEFGYTEYMEIDAYCRDLDILWFATAFDPWAADFLEQFRPVAYKMASGDLTNIPLLQHISEYKRPIIISTGGGTWDDIQRANNAACLSCAEVAFLHCVARYPTPAEEVNLSAIRLMMDALPDRIIGYSCHYNGPLMASLCYLFGARIIEKHFTLDHTAKGSDHAMSLQPDGMRKLVRDALRMKVCQGTGDKRMTDEENRALAKMGKSVWPTRPLPAGTILLPEDLALKTPMVAEGLKPYQVQDIIGKITIHDLSTAAPVKQEDIWGE